MIFKKDIKTANMLPAIFIKCVRTLMALALVRVLAVRHVLVGYE